MSTKITQKVVLERFLALKEAGKHMANPNVQSFRETELHTAALAYAAAVRKVARRERDQ